jgi:hypothetical protein
LAVLAVDDELGASDCVSVVSARHDHGKHDWLAASVPEAQPMRETW